MLKVKTPTSTRETLAQWEKSATLAPLTAAQQDAVIDLASHADDRPLPDLVCSINATLTHQPPGDTEPAKQLRSDLDASDTLPANSLLPGEVCACVLCWLTTRVHTLE